MTKTKFAEIATSNGWTVTDGDAGNWTALDIERGDVSLYVVWTADGKWNGATERSGWTRAHGRRCYGTNRTVTRQRDVLAIVTA